MKSKRIPDYQREGLAAKMARDASLEARYALVVRQAELSERLREWMFSPHFKQVEKLPARFFGSSTNIQSTMTDEHGERHSFNLHFIKEVERENAKTPGCHYGLFIEMKTEARRVPNEKRMPDPESGSILEATLARDLLEYIKDEKAVMNKHEKLRAQIYASLTEMSTTKRLKEHWPEAFEAYCSSYEKEVKAFVPAIPVENINAMITDFPDGVAAE